MHGTATGAGAAAREWRSPARLNFNSLWRARAGTRNTLPSPSNLAVNAVGSNVALILATNSARSVSSLGLENI